MVFLSLYRKIFVVPALAAWATTHFDPKSDNPVPVDYGVDGLCGLVTEDTLLLCLARLFDQFRSLSGVRDVPSRGLALSASKFGGRSFPRVKAGTSLLSDNAHERFVQRLTSSVILTVCVGITGNLFTFYFHVRIHNLIHLM